MLVFPFLLSLFSKHNWRTQLEGEREREREKERKRERERERELYCSNSSCFKIIVVVIISLLFKLTLCKAKIYFFWVGMMLTLYTFITSSFQQSPLGRHLVLMRQLVTLLLMVSLYLCNFVIMSFHNLQYILSVAVR